MNKYMKLKSSFVKCIKIFLYIAKYYNVTAVLVSYVVLSLIV